MYIAVNTCRQAHASVGGYLCTDLCTLTRKNIYCNNFRSPSDAASILKNSRIDTGSKSEIVIKLIENCFFLIIIKN